MLHPDPPFRVHAPPPRREGSLSVPSGACRGQKVTPHSLSTGVRGERMLWRTATARDRRPDSSHAPRSASSRSATSVHRRAGARARSQCGSSALLGPRDSFRGDAHAGCRRGCRTCPCSPAGAARIRLCERVTAAILWGLPLPRRWEQRARDMVEVAVPAARTRVRRAGVTCRRLQMVPGDVVEGSGIRLLSPARLWSTSPIAYRCPSSSQ